MLKKGIILVLLSSVFTVYQLNAQDDFSIGPRVGVNFSNVSNVSNSKSLTGLALGLTSTYSINETSGLTVDLLYSNEGYAISDNKYKIAYLQIPIYYDLFFGKLGDSFRPKVYVGIQPGFLLHAKYNDTEVDKSSLNSFNAALSGGAGFNYKIASRIWLNADLRAFLGLSDISEAIADKQANNTIQVSLGLAYGLSKL